MLFLVAISFSPSQYWSFTSFVFWRMTSSHGTFKNIQQTLGANIYSSLIPPIFKHMSIGPLVVWSDRLPLSDCDHHWSQLNAIECAWIYYECMWTSNNVERVLNALEHAWTHLKLLERALSAHERLWVRIECSWVHVNTIEGVWVWLNPLSYWFLYEIVCPWTPLSECECDWMHLNLLWVHVNAFECVLNALEHTRMCSECLWVSIECTWMHLNALWVCMNVFERVWDVTECSWMHLSVPECLWVSMSLCHCTPLVEIV
jgi:hypothetical protein